MKETVQDIIDEMRMFCDGFSGSEVCVTAHQCRGYADRLEAAINPSAPQVCANCKHYSSQMQYCGVIDSSICKGVAKEIKAIGCEKWEAR